MFTFWTVAVIVVVVVCILVIAFVITNDNAKTALPAGIAAIVCVLTLVGYIGWILKPHQEAESDRAFTDLATRGYSVVSVWVPPISAKFQFGSCVLEFDLKKVNGHYRPFESVAYGKRPVEPNDQFKGC